MITKLVILSLAVLSSGIPFRAENPRVLIKTELGDILVEVDEARAPITAANFLRYDGAVFHRTVTPDNQPNDKIRIEVIQGGILADDKTFAPISHETTEQTGITHRDGTVSMARTQPGSATSSFFICVNPQPELDFGGRRNPDGQGFAAFGRVLSGMDVVRRIQASPREGQNLSPPIRMISVHRVTR